MASIAQAVVNSGTSVGVVGAGLVATAVAEPSVAWPLMAGLCLAGATAVVVVSTGTRFVNAPPGTVRRTPTLRVPILAALGAGFLSAATWTYGPTAVVAKGALAPDRVGLLWTALGLGGVAGAFINRPVSRCGPATTFLICTTTLLVTSIAVLAPTLEGPWWPLIGAACFGAAYMAMSGVLILWGRLLDPQHGAALTAWLFLALAVGQAAGAQLLGFTFA